MTRLAVLCALCATAPLFGQTKEVVEEVDSLVAQAKVADERNEDIEVLRRLLNQTFGFDHATSQLPELMQPYTSGNTAQSLFHGGAGGGAFGGGDGFGSQPAVALPLGKRVSQAVGPFDAVYLKGGGVVFTLRVPKEEMQFGHGLCVGSIDKQLGLGTSCNKCHQFAHMGHADGRIPQAKCATCHSDTKKFADAGTEWDRIRADVRGEKPPPTTTGKPTIVVPAPMCMPGDLRELIVAQLHAHAKHLRHLEPTDRVTVVITFDEVPVARRYRPVSPSDKPGFTADELQALTLGDLHLKQGKPAEAVAAYEKGLARYRDAVIRLTFPPTVSAAEVPKVIAETQKNVRGLFKSLATAHLQTNDLDKAKAALDLATSLTVELATAGAENAKPRLPAKIVLAVGKSDIDRGVKRDEFRKAVSVDTPGVPPPEKK